MEETMVEKMTLEKTPTGYDLVAYFKDGGKYLAATFEKKPSVKTWHTVADWLWPLVEEAARSDDGYGLAFMACGYDGQAQTEFARSYKERFGAYVF